MTLEFLTAINDLHEAVFDGLANAVCEFRGRKRNVVYACGQGVEELGVAGQMAHGMIYDTISMRCPMSYFPALGEGDLVLIDSKPHKVRTSMTDGEGYSRTYLLEAE